MTTRTFEVTIAAHVVPERVPEGARWRRFEIAEQTHEVVELDAARACREAVRRAHIAVGVPAWRPYARESVRHATARRVTSAREEEMMRVRRGGRA